MKFLLMAVMPCCALCVWAGLVHSVHSVHCFVNRCLTGLTSHDFKNLFRWSSGDSSFSVSSQLSPEGRNKLHPGVKLYQILQAQNLPCTPKSSASLLCSNLILLLAARIPSLHDVISAVELYMFEPLCSSQSREMSVETGR